MKILFYEFVARIKYFQLNKAWLIKVRFFCENPLEYIVSGDFFMYGY